MGPAIGETNAVGNASVGDSTKGGPTVLIAAISKLRGPWRSREQKVGESTMQLAIWTNWPIPVQLRTPFSAPDRILIIELRVDIYDAI